jgi:hypothetical protein
MKISLTRGRDTMIIYSVEITIEAGIGSEWLDWMKRVHVADVVRTGCFSECRIYKVVDSAATEPSYVMQYQCRSLEEYHRYRDSFAPALQKGTPIDLPDAFGVLAGSWRRSRLTVKHPADGAV